MVSSLIIWLLGATASVLLLAGQGLAATPDLSLAALGLRGTVALDYFSSDHSIDDRRHFPGLNLTVQQRYSFGDSLRWVGETRVLAEEVGHGEEDPPHASIRDLRYADQVTAELREGYLDLTHSDWELRAGRQIIVWGRADEINPTDVLSPKNFRLLLPDGQPAYRFGVDALKLDYFFKHDLRATAVWLPITSVSVIPVSDPPPGVHVEYRPPAVRLENGIAGVKLDHTGSIDASLAYAYGYNLLPEVRLTELPNDPTTGAFQARADLRNARQHMVGVDFATTRGTFGLRGEVAYFQTANPNGTRLDGVTPYLFYVLGLEKTFPSSASVIVQYVGRWVRNRVDPARVLGTPSTEEEQAQFLAARDTFIINQQLDTIQNGWSLRIDKKFRNDTLDCELLGVQYFERNDFYLRPRVTYDVTDAWRISTGAEIFGGPSVSFFGRVKENTGVFSELRYSF